MPASGYEDDFYVAFACTSQRIQVPLRDLKLRVEQSAVNIYGKKPDRRSHQGDSNIWEAAVSGG